jgi:hypothetical protein
MPMTNLYTAFKSAPSARQADRPLAMLAENARYVHGRSDERAGGRAAEAARVAGRLAAGGWAAWLAASSAGAHRRGPLPAAPFTPHPAAAHPAVTHRGSRAPRAGRAVVSRLVCRSPVKVTATGPERRASSGSAARAWPYKHAANLPTISTKCMRTNVIRPVSATLSV